jgi:membrane protein implicated in regulation of membrane protease activity
MPTGSDWLTNLFLYIFAFGLVFTVVSLLLGAVHIGSMGHIHLGGAGHGHAGHVGHMGHEGLGHKADVHLGGHHSNGDSAVDALGPLNMPTIMAFITWFGGAGYIFSRALPFGGAALVLMALASGLFGGTIMFLLLSRLLWPMMSKPLSRADFSLPGTAARVVSPIREGGTGEIVYNKAHTRFTAGARSVADAAISQGTEVVIMRYERGIAYVQPVHEILDAVAHEAETR